MLENSTCWRTWWCYLCWYWCSLPVAVKNSVRWRRRWLCVFLSRDFRCEWQVGYNKVINKLCARDNVVTLFFIIIAENIENQMTTEDNEQEQKMATRKKWNEVRRWTLGDHWVEAIWHIPWKTIYNITQYITHWEIIIKLVIHTITTEVFN